MVEIAEQCRKGGYNNLNFSPKQKWDDNTYIQWGKYRHHHIDMNTGKISDAYFLEVFPKNPRTFIRVTGQTLDSIEKKALSLLNKYKSCQKHEFERRGYDNGAGFCKRCGFFQSDIFPLGKPKKLKKRTEAHFKELKIPYDYKKNVKLWKESYGNLNQDIPLVNQCSTERILEIRDNETEVEREERELNQMITKGE